jgi:CIC family chloride channel protein
MYATKIMTRSLKIAFESAAKTMKEMRFLFLCALIGVIAGLGAVFFRVLIAIVHNALFYGRLSAVYDANMHSLASPWGFLVILVPMVGAVVVTFLVTNFAPEASGTGVPEIMAAIFYKKGSIRPIVFIVKALASSFTIGSGGSAGREGPIMLMGSTCGSVFGHIFSLSPWQKIILVACGAAGGIAATYDTPIGGILFVSEILLHEVSVRTLVPLAFSTTAAVILSRAIYGDLPAFIIPIEEASHLSTVNLTVFGACIGLGVIAGILSVIYIKFVYHTEDLFNMLIKSSLYLRHMTGMLVTGVLMFILFFFTGRYYIEGIGYATIQDLLSGQFPILPLLILLLLLKLLVTAITLGSGGSGGIFSPTLFLGATFSGVFGSLIHGVFPDLIPGQTVFVLAGMAAMVGGTTGAATAAIVMILEMTHVYSAAIPVTIAVACSIGVRRVFLHESIYTMKLARQGRILTDTLLRDIHDLRHEEEKPN